ncbi:DUF4307 domain-containing protein [Demequina sp. NBRC 110057]|uniref:DUF4307 domain-containing protein n=1 Tax=Demequina sp. NBRC 110057 TaxID=1570346 RepID=UPI0013565CAB|nr:DUF4307 domain-containing protein [Demequina sp. NBRC 110057]
MSEPAHTPGTDDVEDVASGRPRLSRRGWVLSILGVAALTAVAAWFGLSQANQPVRWQDVGFAIDSPTQAEITFDVHLYTDEPAVCQVRALSTSYAEVGVAEVTVDPAEGTSQRITLPITTVEEATSAQVNYCEVAQ